VAPTDRLGRGAALVPTPTARACCRPEGGLTAADEERLVRFVDLLAVALGSLWAVRNARKAAAGRE
jgi:hypothetical protein